MLRLLIQDIPKINTSLIQNMSMNMLITGMSCSNLHVSFKVYYTALSSQEDVPSGLMSMICNSREAIRLSSVSQWVASLWWSGSIVRLYKFKMVSIRTIQEFQCILYVRVCGHWSWVSLANRVPGVHGFSRSK